MKHSNINIKSNLMQNFRKSLLRSLKIGGTALFATVLIASCGDDDETTTPPIVNNNTEYVGAVYAMSNGSGQGNDATNSVLAYGRNEDGSLASIGTTLTGGDGGDFDGGEGLDPLISAYALSKSADNNLVFAVNAGSNTLSTFTVNDDFTLTLADQKGTNGTGPNTIASYSNMIFVANIDSDGVFNGEPDQEGSLQGFWVAEDGVLTPIEGSWTQLRNRPSAVQFSPDGSYLVVSSINAGSVTLASDSQDEIVVYAVGSDGTLSAQPTGSGTSTLRGNSENRNLPSAIGFQIVGDNYVVVTEAREFQADGTPPAFTKLQSGSVSTFQIMGDGSLRNVQLDVPTGDRATESGRTACWLDFADDNTFFVSNAIEAGLASFRFNGSNGNITLLDELAGEGVGAGTTTNPQEAFTTTEGWIDLWISDDGKHLYQLHGFGSKISVYEINGDELNLVEELNTELPENNVQGIVAI